MPLGFNSITHGIVNFGFFNIRTDMILLDKYAFFSTDFCKLVKKMLTNANRDFSLDWEIFEFDDRSAIGDLHGAIARKIYSGFIGSVYNRFPFPKDYSLFKQSTKSHETQDTISKLIEPFAHKIKINTSLSLSLKIVVLGRYKFDFSTFTEILKYILIGGYPRWDDKLAPGHVRQMQKNISRNKIFDIESVQRGFE